MLPPLPPPLPPPFSSPSPSLLSIPPLSLPLPTLLLTPLLCFRVSLRIRSPPRKRLQATSADTTKAPRFYPAALPNADSDR